MAELNGHFDDRDEMQDRGDHEREERGFEKAFAAAEQNRDYVQKPDSVERSGHTEPENGHFVHLFLV